MTKQLGDSGFDNLNLATSQAASSMLKYYHRNMKPSCQWNEDFVLVKSDTYLVAVD